MTVQHTTYDSIAVVTLDDGRVNAVNETLCESLTQELSQVCGHSAVVLTGRPHIFSAGLDLHALCGISKEDAHTLFLAMSASMEAVLTFPRPIVVACSGHAVGAGAVLILACDERIGGSSGKLHINATRLGIPYPTAALEIVEMALGKAVAQRTLLLGEPVTGSCRQRLGWLHDVVPDAQIRDIAIEKAKKLSTLDTQAFADTKLRLRELAVEKISRERERDAERFAKAILAENTQKRIQTAVEAINLRKEGRTTS